MCASDFILVKLPCFAQQMCTNQYKQVQSTLNYQFLHAYVYKFIQMCTSDFIPAYISNFCIHIPTSSYKFVQATSFWPK